MSKVLFGASSPFYQATTHVTSPLATEKSHFGPQAQVAT